MIVVDNEERDRTEGTGTEESNHGNAGQGQASHRSWEDIRIAATRLPTLTEAEAILEAGKLVQEIAAKAISEGVDLANNLQALSTLSSIKKSRKGTDWRKAVERAWLQAEREVRAAQQSAGQEGEADRPTAGTLLRDIEAWHVPEEDGLLMLPPKYSVHARTGAVLGETDDGVALVTPQPLYVRRHLTDPDDEMGDALEIRFLDDNAWKTHIIPLGDLADQRRFTRHAGAGLAMPPVGVGAIRTYIYECQIYGERTLQGIPGSEIVREIELKRCGLYKGRDGKQAFAFFGGAIGGSAKVKADSTVARLWENRVVGSLDEEFGVFIRVARDHPKAGFLAGCAASAPYLRTLRRAGVLDIDSFVAETADDRGGTGKTTTMQYAALPWGGLDLIRTGGMTEYAATSMAATQSDLPLYWQELQASMSHKGKGGNFASLPGIIHALADGGTKGQGKRDGGLRSTSVQRLYNVLMTANNVSAMQIVENDGDRARIVSLGSVFPVTDDGKSREIIKDLKKEMVKAHGHGGPAMIEALLSILEDSERVQEFIIDRYNACLKALEAAVPKEIDWQINILSRLAQPVAAGQLGLFSILHWGYGVEEAEAEEIAQEATMEAWAEVCRRADADRMPDHVRARELVAGQLAARQIQIIGAIDINSADYRPPNEFIATLTEVDVDSEGQVECVAVLPDAVKRILEGGGFDLDTMLKAWDRDGTIIRDGDGKHFQRRVSWHRPGAKPEKVRAIVFHRKALWGERDDDGLFGTD